MAPNDQATPKERYRIRIKSTKVGGVPIPQFENRCVCCNVPTAEKVEARIGNNDDYLILGKVMLPTCPDCKLHVNWRSMLLDKVFGYSIPFALFLVILMFFGVDLLGFEYFVLVLIPSAVYIFYWYVIARRLGGHGHHSGMEIYVSEQELDIRTSNRELVERISLEMKMRQNVEIMVKPKLKPPA